MNVFTIHHTAGSGGSICSQFFAACANALLISEIDPHGILYETNLKDSEFNKKLMGYNPGRPLNHALVDSGRDLSPALKEKFFLYQLDICFDHASEMRKSVLLREHTHSAYGFCGRQTLSLLELLARLGNGFWRNYLIKFWRPVLTVRHPLDNFLSARPKQWHKTYAKDGSFDSYCREILLMQKCFVNQWGALVLRYEDLCLSKDNFLKSLSSGLECSFLESPSANEIDSVTVTGKSGRRGSEIGLRQRRVELIDEELKATLGTSKAYQKLCALNNYCLDYDAGPV